MAKIEFIIPVRPIPKSRPRITKKGGKFWAYTPVRTKHAEKEFLNYANGYKPKDPLNGSIELEVHFVFEIPKSWPKSKKEKALRGELPHISRPDLDNLLKFIKDALNMVFWKDDSQITKYSSCSKSYGKTSYTHIIIKS